MTSPVQVSNTAASGGIGFFGLLTIVLLVLKVLGYIDISWFLVFLPVLIPIFVVLLIFLIVGVFLNVAWTIDKVRRARR